MITKTIKTPFRIQLFFIAFVVIMMTPFFAYIASASPVKLSYNYCDKIYYDTFVGQVRPEYNKICKNRFQYLTNSIKRSFINNHK